VLAAAARGRWPGAELEALVGYARAEVLRQASEDETLLFPAGASPAASRLARDHARLRACTETLARAASAEQALSLGELAAVTRDFVCQLERHLRAEEEIAGSRTRTSHRARDHGAGPTPRSRRRPGTVRRRHGLLRDRLERSRGQRHAGIVLAAVGVAVTVAAGFLGWTLVQDYHVGIRLAPEQELAEPAIQHTQPAPLRRRHAA